MAGSSTNCATSSRQTLRIWSFNRSYQFKTKFRIKVFALHLFCSNLMAMGSLFQYLAEMEDSNFPDIPLKSGRGTLRFARPRVVGPLLASVKNCSRLFQAAMNRDVSRMSSTDEGGIGGRRLGRTRVLEDQIWHESRNYKPS